MKTTASLAGRIKRGGKKIQVTTRTRNKSGEFKGIKKLVAAYKRINGKAGRYAVRQGS